MHSDRDKADSVLAAALCVFTGCATAPDVAANWFIALPVTAGDWYRTLVAPDGVRLFDAQDLHVTVAFLGPVSEERALAAFAHAQAFSLPIIDVRLSSVVALGGQRRPSAFSALLGRGRSEVEGAIAEVRERMWLAAEARIDTRPPLAHITLARPLRRATTEQVQRAKRWALALDLGEPECRLDRIALYTWSLDRSQTLFRVVRALQLTEAGSTSARQ